jgi:hypothetical protein
MGMTTAEFNKQLETGKILSEDFLPKFAKALTDTYEGPAKKAANEAGANWNRFKNMMSDSLKSVGTGLSGFFNSIIKFAIGVYNGFSKVQQAAKPLTDALGSLFSKIGVIFQQMGLFGDAASAGEAATSALAIAVKILLIPLQALATVFDAVVTAGVNVIGFFAGMNSSATAVGGVIGKLSEAVGNLISGKFAAARNNWEEVKKAGEKVASSYMDGYNSVMDKLKSRAQSTTSSDEHPDIYEPMQQKQKPKQDT